MPPVFFLVFVFSLVSPTRLGSQILLPQLSLELEERAVPHMHYSQRPRAGLVPLLQSLARATVLLLALNLVVPSDHLRVAGRRCVAAALASVAVLRLLRLGCRRRRRRGRRRSRRRAGRGVVAAAGRAVVHAWLWLGLAPVLASVGVDEDVRDAPALGVLRERLVIIVGLGVLGNEVPRVDEAGDLRVSSQHVVSACSD